jgi:hypothetical protein
MVQSGFRPSHAVIRSAFPGFVSRVEGAVSGRYASPAAIWTRRAPLLDSDSTPTLQWRESKRLLQEHEYGLDATARMPVLLGDLDLFSPFAFQVMQDDAASPALRRMRRVEEEKRKAAKPGKHKTLVTRGMMGKIYPYIYSLENFARLHRRAVEHARITGGMNGR